MTDILNFKRVIINLVWITLCVFFFSSSVLAQRVLQPKLIEFDDKGIIYKNEYAFQARLMENGFSFGYYQGEIISYYKTKFYSLELGFMRDIREKTQSKNYSIATPTNSFIVGKVNSVINVRASLGRKVFLSEKAKRRGLSIGYSYEVGPSIALLKPYYLDLFYPDQEGSSLVVIRSERYSENNADVFLDRSRIFGSSGYFRGIGELKVVTGIQAKAAAHFALGAFDQFLKSAEAGVMIDLYAKPLPILLETEEYRNRALFIRLFVAAQFGVRKSR